METNATLNQRPYQPPLTHKPALESSGLRNLILLLLVGWTLVVGLSLIWNLYQEDQAALSLARQVAHTHFNKDILYWRWNARHGGVYAQLSPHNTPNPNLSEQPDHDFTTPAGKTLTLVNPANMLRQVYEMAEAQGGVQSRITGLKPLNSKNAPDPWEAAALSRLAQGEPEASAIVTLTGQPYLRLLKPIFAEKGCLPCHSQQGYRVGEIRGGLTISVPLEPFHTAQRSQRWAMILGHGFLWLLGLLGIVWSGFQIKEKEQASQRAEAALHESIKKYRELVENANVIIMRVNPQGQVTYFNEYAQKFFGYRETEIIGRPVAGLIVPETDTEGRPLTNLIEEICARPEDHPLFEVEVQKLHGERSWVGWTIRAVRDKSGPVQEILWVGHDITEHRHTEVAASRANADLQSLVYEYGERNRQISLLNRMAELLQACLTPREAYPIIARYCHELFGGCTGGLFVPRDSGKFLEAVAVWGEIIAGQKEFPPNDCWALRTGRSYEGGSLETGIECPHLATQPVDKYLCVPMMAQGETLGLLHLQVESSGSGGEGDLFGDVAPELPHQLAVMVADHVALALANLNLRETLKDQAIRDPLTGLFNRRYLTETLERELHRVNRRAGSLGFIMLDLDHFKEVNDAYGHEGGDALLKAVGSYLKHAVRAGDIACRFGGEEFVLVLPEAPLEVTRERAAALHLGVKNLKVRHQGRELAATVSVGVASYPEHGLTGDDLLQAADAALYRAKEEGRDRVICA